MGLYDNFNKGAINSEKKEQMQYSGISEEEIKQYRQMFARLAEPPKLEFDEETAKAREIANQKLEDDRIKQKETDEYVRDKIIGLIGKLDEKDMEELKKIVSNKIQNMRFQGYAEELIRKNINLFIDAYINGMQKIYEQREMMSKHSSYKN